MTSPATYTPNSLHRNTSYAAKKSQWAIPIADEVTCYKHAWMQGWNCNNNHYWGLHLVDAAIPSPLGVSPIPEAETLHIAKFVVDQGNWHGYPVAHWLSPFDKPGESILKSWLKSGYINAAKFSRIHRGKKCVL